MRRKLSHYEIKAFAWGTACLAAGMRAAVGGYLGQPLWRIAVGAIACGFIGSWLAVLYCRNRKFE